MNRFLIAALAAPLMFSSQAKARGFFFFYSHKETIAPDYAPSQEDTMPSLYEACHLNDADLRAGPPRDPVVVAREQTCIEQYNIDGGTYEALGVR
jgi:hypothetical protein